MEEGSEEFVTWYLHDWREHITIKDGTCYFALLPFVRSILPTLSYGTLSSFTRWLWSDASEQDATSEYFVWLKFPHSPRHTYGTCLDGLETMLNFKPATKADLEKFTAIVTYMESEDFVEFARYQLGATAGRCEILRDRIARWVLLPVPKRKKSVGGPAAKRIRTLQPPAEITSKEECTPDQSSVNAFWCHTQFLNAVCRYVDRKQELSLLYNDHDLTNYAYLAGYRKSNQLWLVRPEHSFHSAILLERCSTLHSSLQEALSGTELPSRFAGIFYAVDLPFEESKNSLTAALNRLEDDSAVLALVVPPNLGEFTDLVSSWAIAHQRTTQLLDISPYGANHYVLFKLYKNT